MSLQYAHDLLDDLIAESNEKKSAQFRCLKVLLDSGKFFDLTDKELRKATGLKQSFISNIKSAINDQINSKWVRSFIIYTTKHKTISLMNLARRREAKLNPLLTANVTTEKKYD